MVVPIGTSNRLTNHGQQNMQKTKNNPRADMSRGHHARASQSHQATCKEPHPQPGGGVMIVINAAHRIVLKSVLEFAKSYRFMIRRVTWADLYESEEGFHTSSLNTACHRG